MGAVAAWLSPHAIVPPTAPWIVYARTSDPIADVNEAIDALGMRNIAWLAARVPWSSVQAESVLSLGAADGAACGGYHPTPAVLGAVHWGAPGLPLAHPRHATSFGVIRPPRWARSAMQLLPTIRPDPPTAVVHSAWQWSGAHTQRLVQSRALSTPAPAAHGSASIHYSRIDPVSDGAHAVVVRDSARAVYNNMRQLQLQQAGASVLLCRASGAAKSLSAWAVQGGGVEEDAFARDVFKPSRDHSRHFCLNIGDMPVTDAVTIG
jgi:hypothetical protein